MMNSYVTGCDYLLIGDEFYGCSAKLSEDRTMVASVVGLDYLKWLSIVIAAVVAIAIGAVGWDAVSAFLTSGV
jgi:hypothetical protein